jgi:tetratricopeptide (TPR) repeat protein
MSVDTVPASEVAPSPTWAQTIRRANAHYRVGRLQRAIQLYAAAAALIEEEWGSRRLLPVLLLARVVTWQNWAAALVRAGEAAAADRRYREIHALLWRVLGDAGQPEGLRAIALRQCQMTAAEWALCRREQAGEVADVIH